MPHKLVRVIVALFLAAAPLTALARSIVGMAIAKSNDYVFTWFDDGTFTEGTSSDLEAYRHAFPYNGDGTTKPSDIVAMSIAGDDHVYTWYRDGTVSEGTSGELTKYSQARKSVTLPQNETMADIVGIGIAGSDDKVYIWFRDRTVWIGNSRSFTLDGPHPYQLPNDPYNPSALLTVDDIVEMDIAKNDHVYTWYRNGMHSEGSSGNLARYSMGPYIKARVLYNWWAPLKTLPPGIGPLGGKTGQPPGGYIAPQPAHPAGPAIPPVPGPAGPGAARQANTGVGLKLPPGPIKTYDNATGPQSVKFLGGEKDPMVALSKDYMVISGATTIFFADRQGNALPGMPSSPMNISDFFGAFIDPSPANEIRLDRNVGFVGACDGPGIPAVTAGHQDQPLVGYCVTDFYDARAYFDSVSKHFFIVAHLANNVQVNFTGNFDGALPGACGYYKVPPGDKIPPFKGKYKVNLFKPEDCLWSRFLFAFAVSKTENPADGFNQYVLTDNMEADFPWLAVNRNRVVLANHNKSLEPPEWPSKMPVVQVFDLTAVVRGDHHPAYFRYFPEDLDGAKAVQPPTHHGDTQGLTFLVAGAGETQTLTMFGFPDTYDPWTVPSPIEVTETLGYSPPATIGAVYRGGNLYFVSPHQKDSSGDKKLNSVRVTRIPITRYGNQLSTSTNSSDGFLDYNLGNNNPNEDGPNDQFSYDDASIDVNAAGDMLIGYHRGPFTGKALFPEARVTFWPAGAPGPQPSQLVRAGGAPGVILVDYTTTVVDPADDNAFWVALPFVDNNGNHATTISYIP